MNAQDKINLTQWQHSARTVVREIGYVAGHKELECPTAETQGYEYSRIMHAYDMACAHLIAIDPVGAPEFIRTTYGPSFRQTVNANGY